MYGISVVHKIKQRNHAIYVTDRMFWPNPHFM